MMFHSTQTAFHFHNSRKLLKKWLAFLLSKPKQASFTYETKNSNSLFSFIFNDQMVLLIWLSFDFESMIKNVNRTK